MAEERFTGWGECAEEGAPGDDHGLVSMLGIIGTEYASRVVLI